MVATFFIIKDRALLRRFILQIIPGSARSQSQDVIAELFRALIGFLKAYGILISITAIVVIIGLKIIGVEYAFTIGIVTGLLDILPILGQVSFYSLDNLGTDHWQYPVGSGSAHLVFDNFSYTAIPRAQNSGR